MNPQIVFKNWGTFQLTGYYQGPAGNALPSSTKSQVREIDRDRYGGVTERLIAELEVTLGTSNAEAGTYTYVLSCDDTSDWPEGTLYMDVLYTYPDGRKTHTETLRVLVQRGLTRE